jgi:glutathione synthase
LRDCNEKLFATAFPQCCPPLLVSRNAVQLRQFINAHGDVILKPLDGMGGDSIFRVTRDDPNISVIIETLTAHGSRTIMGQLYLPEIKDGDKRILVINGEPVPYCLARVPTQGESRGNLAAGGQGIAQPLSDRDRWICEQVSAELVARGIMLAGLDVIGEFLTEINVTSPTCLREISTAYDIDIASQLIGAIDQAMSSGN